MPQITASPARRSMLRRARAPSDGVCARAGIAASTDRNAARMTLIMRDLLLTPRCRLEASPHLFDDLVDAEARWPLARRILFEGVKELRRYGRGWQGRGRHLPHP